MPKIFDIFVRFRSNEYAIISDIQSAFLKIRVAEEDRDFLRFLSVKDIVQKDFELFVKRFTSVMFCLTSSPSLLSMTVDHHVLKYLNLNQDLIIKFLNDLYIDDSNSRSDSSEKCFEFCLRMKTILKEGNFNLRKWISSCDEIMD